MLGPFMTRARTALPYVLAVAFGLRLIAAAGVEWIVSRDPDRRFLIAGDAEGYWELALKVTRGETYAVHDPPRYALRTPGFPVVLAVGLLLTGGSVLGVRVWLAAIGTLCCGLVYVLGRRVADEPTAIVATAVTAVAPTLAGFSVLVLSETAFAATMLGTLIASVAMLRNENESRFGLAFAVGLVMSLAVYVRPAWILAAPVVAGVDLLRARSRVALLRGGLIAAGLAIGLAPWTIRNAVVTGHFVPTTLWLGPTLYDGLHPGADGGSDMRFYEEDGAAGLTAGMSEYEVDRHYRSRAWEFVRENPGRVVVLGWAKQLRFWSPWPNATQFRHPVGIVAVLAFFVPMILLALRGARAMQADPVGLLAVVGPLLYFALLHTVFVGSLRYRLPAEYPLWIAAAAGLLAWRPGWRRWLSESPRTGAHPA